MLTHLGLQLLREPEDRLRGGVVRVGDSREETKVSPAYRGHKGKNVNHRTQLGEPCVYKLLTVFSDQPCTLRTSDLTSFTGPVIGVGTGGGHRGHVPPHVS